MSNGPSSAKRLCLTSTANVVCNACCRIGFRFYCLSPIFLRYSTIKARRLHETILEMDRISGARVRKHTLEQITANGLRRADQMSRCIAHHQLSIDRLDRGRSRLLDRVESCAAAVRSALAQCCNYIISTTALRDRRKVEHIARLEIPAAEINLLGDNLGGRLKCDRPSADFARTGGLGNDTRGADEVDLAEIQIGELQNARAVAVIAVRAPFERNPLGLGIEEGQDLGIIEKQINVVAFAMIDLQHKRSAATEAPVRRESIGALEMIENADG